MDHLAFCGGGPVESWCYLLLEAHLVVMVDNCENYVEKRNAFYPSPAAVTIEIKVDHCHLPPPFQKNLLLLLSIQYFHIQKVSYPQTELGVQRYT